MSDQQPHGDAAGIEDNLEREGHDPTHASTDELDEDEGSNENVSEDSQGSETSYESDDKNKSDPYIITVIISSKHKYFGNEAKFILLDYNPEILIVEFESREGKYVVIELEVKVEERYRPLLRLMKPYLVIEKKGVKSNLSYIMKTINFLSNMLAPAEITVDIDIYPGAPRDVMGGANLIKEELELYKLPKVISFPTMVPLHSETGTYKTLDEARVTGMRLCAFFRRVGRALRAILDGDIRTDLLGCIKELDSSYPRALASLAVDKAMELRSSIVMDCLREIAGGKGPLVLQDLFRLRYAVACYILESMMPPIMDSMDSNYLNLFYVAQAMYRAVFLDPTAPVIEVHRRH